MEPEKAGGACPPPVLLAIVFASLLVYVRATHAMDRGLELVHASTPFEGVIIYRSYLFKRKNNVWRFVREALKGRDASWASRDHQHRQRVCEVLALGLFVVVPPQRVPLCSILTYSHARLALANPFGIRVKQPEQ